MENLESIEKCKKMQGGNSYNPTLQREPLLTFWLILFKIIFSVKKYSFVSCFPPSALHKYFPMSLTLFINIVFDGCVLFRPMDLPGLTY